MTTSSKKSAAADEAAALPDFQAGTLYDLQLSKPVEFPPGSGNYLRPGNSVQLDGAYCLEHRDAISGAAEFREPGAA